MKLSMIVAMNHDLVIGNEGKLPWDIPRDLKNFRKITWDKPVIMGRKTRESINGNLPGRTGIVLTRSPDIKFNGCKMAENPGDAIRIARETRAAEAIVIGGTQVYRDFLPLVSTIYLTMVEGKHPGDTYFPENVTESRDWRLAFSESWPEESATFMILKKGLH